MKSTRRTLRALGGAASLILVGCWTPAPYGYNTYPGYYAPPPNQGFVAPPGGTIVSPGPVYPAPQPQLGPPSSLPPSGGNWQPAPGPGPTPAPTQVMPPPNSGSLAPLPGAPQQTFDNAPSRFSPPQVGSSRRPEVPVPDPVDPGPRPSPGPSAGPPPSDSSPFGSEGGKEPFDKGTQMEVPQRVGGPQSIASREPEPFEAPLDRGGKIDTGVVEVAAKTVDAKTRIQSPNRYDYDRTSYSYVRGVVDFNSHDKTWHIIYSPNPERTDKYGGAFELIDCPKLRQLHDGDVVFIQGRVHPRIVDSRGKPKYEVGNEVARITYRGMQSVGN
jgi:hypothetical protein